MSADQGIPNRDDISSTIEPLNGDPRLKSQVVMWALLGHFFLLSVFDRLEQAQVTPRLWGTKTKYSHLKVQSASWQKHREQCPELKIVEL